MKGLNKHLYHKDIFLFTLYVAIIVIWVWNDFIIIINLFFVSRKISQALLNMGKLTLTLTSTLTLTLPTQP